MSPKSQWDLVGDQQSLIPLPLFIDYLTCMIIQSIISSCTDLQDYTTNIFKKYFTLKAKNTLLLLSWVRCIYIICNYE